MITNERAKALSFLGLNKPTLESNPLLWNPLKMDSKESQTYIFQVKLGHNAPPV